jgi:uncharacterized OsmC-like protein
MAAVAANKGIIAERLDAVVERSTVQSESWHTEFNVHIDIGAGLSSRERIILFNSARQCEVHKLLTGEVSFTYNLAIEEPVATPLDLEGGR